jgi:hypothetical protein
MRCHAEILELQVRDLRLGVSMAGEARQPRLIPEWLAALARFL